MNPYRQFVSDVARIVSTGSSLPTGGFPSPVRDQLVGNRPVGLIFSPHPDDECIVGGFALRLLREAGLRVINVAVTQGSNKERQIPRLHELEAACRWLGFELEQTAPNGLDQINPAARSSNPGQWGQKVQVIAASLQRHTPQVLFFPHDLDCNSTHIGTHLLIMDALKVMPASFECFLVESEFWGQMSSPNLMVEINAEDLADLVAALSFHAGEVKRNPFHLRLPAWMQDNVRRGAELVGKQGDAAPDFMFATLYRLRQWSNGAARNVYTGGLQVGQAEFPGTVFGWHR